MAWYWPARHAEHMPSRKADGVVVSSKPLSHDVTVWGMQGDVPL